MKQISLLLTLLLILLHGHASGTSITYQGFKCLNAVDAGDSTLSSIPVQSKFEVIDNIGHGIYRLSLTGGIPRIVDNSAKVCIDSETAIGYSGIPELDGIPQPLEAIDATAFFNGKDLVIVVSSIYTDLSARRNPLSSFSTSLIFTFTNTLILEYFPDASIFNLKKIIHNRGFTQTNGSTSSITPFFETILPSFNEKVRDKPKVLTPVVNIEFVLEK